MKLPKLLLVALGCMMAVCVLAAENDDDERLDPQEIRSTDVPADAPAFGSYPASLYEGPNAPLQLRNDKEARRYRTRLREWSTDKVNFAGHYILGRWGCGSGCQQIMIIDAMNGHVFHPHELGNLTWYDVDVLLFDGGEGSVWPNEGPLKFTPTSKLIVAIGAPNEDSKRRGISYYVWDHDRLRLIRRVSKPFVGK